MIVCGALLENALYRFIPISSDVVDGDLVYRIPSPLNEDMRYSAAMHECNGASGQVHTDGYRILEQIT